MRLSGSVYIKKGSLLSRGRSGSVAGGRGSGAVRHIGQGAGRMDITKRAKGDIVVLDISGEIDLYNAPEIKDIINKLIEEMKYNVIINLERVSYIDSSGIGALISSLSNLKKYHGGLKIINVYASVRKVFELTKLTSFFDIYESEEDAIEAFSG
jgi:anti-sigma B factor antagonist